MLSNNISEVTEEQQKSQNAYNFGYFSQIKYFKLQILNFSPQIKYLYIRTRLSRSLQTFVVRNQNKMHLEMKDAEVG